MYPRPEEDKALDDIQEQIRVLLTNHNRLGLAAIARVVWDEIKDGSISSEQQGGQSK